MSEKTGVVGGSGYSTQAALQSAADWYDTVDVTIGTDNLDLTTDYAGYDCKAISNVGSEAATVKYRTGADIGETDQTIQLPNSGDFSGKQPVISTIRGSSNGTTSGAVLKLYLQKRG